MSKNRFSQAVWQLHSKVFHGYNLWLNHVDIKQPRTDNSAAMLESNVWDSLAAIHGLITDLAMYFLVRYGCL